MKGYNEMKIEDIYKIVEKSNFFNADFYVETNNDIRQGGVDPVKHYCESGYVEKRIPIPVHHVFFKRLFNREINHIQCNPVLYLEYLKRTNILAYENLLIWKNVDEKNYKLLKDSELFDPDYYLLKNEDVSKENINPYIHYLQKGQDENRLASAKHSNTNVLYSNSTLGRSVIAWERNSKHVNINSEYELRRNMAYEARNKSILNTSVIKSIISNPEIKIISFDIFDTLLYRPSLAPDDIFRLVDILLGEDSKYNFYEIRSNIEHEIGDVIANFDEIYEYLRKKYKIPHRIIHKMKQLEKQVEADLLTARAEIFDLYNHAVSLGKRVICISDMYYSSEFLRTILYSKGYDKIDKVYVSNEMFAVKGNTLLYVRVLEQEKVSPDEILHIGDNVLADTFPCHEIGMHSIYYPKAKDILLSDNKIGRIFKEPADLFARMILGFVFNEYARFFEYKIHRSKFVQDFAEIINLGLFPVILSIALYILNHKIIQNSYEKVYFASRDGYQPYRIYEILRSYCEHKIIPGEYLYAGRRAYDCLDCETIYDYFQSCRHSHMVSGQQDSLYNILKHVITDKNILHRILDENNVSLDTKTPMVNDVFDMLHKYDDELEVMFKKKKQEAINYYRSKICKKSDREIVFDIGYSGTISRYITPVLCKPLDKIYLLSLPYNLECDRKYQTRTYQILSEENKPPSWLSVLYEELFAPLEGGCISFNNLNPIFEEIHPSETMTNKYNSIDSILDKLTIKFANIFKKYIRFFNIDDYKALQFYLNNAIFDERNELLNYLHDIEFSDLISNNAAPSLADKISEKMEYNHSFEGTAFTSDNILKPSFETEAFTKDINIAIHVHMHEIFIAQEILSYLIDFPFAFDLIITYDNTKNGTILNTLYRGIIPNLNKLKLILVPNRGRDVSAWIYALRGIQEKYDFVCHLHSKISVTSTIGNRWRHYLFDNLISKESASAILNLLNADEKLGCVFPPPFPELKNDWIEHNVDPFGLFGEKDIAISLLKKMDINIPYVRSKLIFSMGTMLWYRPKALKQLFSYPLHMFDFKQEPIGVGGTIGHAIERMIGHICTYNGYKAKMFIAG